MPIHMQALTRVEVADRLSDLYDELLTAKEVVESNIGYQKQGLRELEYRQDSDPEEIIAYKKDIDSNQRALLLVDNKLSRYDKIRVQQETPSLVISKGTSRAELAVCLEKIKEQLQGTKNKADKNCLTGIYESLEAWKERLSMNAVSIEADVVIPLLKRDQKICAPLLTLADFQHRYQIANAQDKYAIFLQAIEANTGNQLNFFLDRVCKDTTFIQQSTFLKKISEVYPLLLAGCQKAGFSAEETAIFNALKTKVSTLITATTMPLDGDILHASLNDEAWLVVSQLSLKADSYSFVFKQLINDFCKQVKLAPPFTVTEITDQMIKSFHDMKKEFRSFEKLDVHESDIDIENPLANTVQPKGAA